MSRLSVCSVVGLLFVAIASTAVLAAPATQEPGYEHNTPIPIISQSESNSADGTFNYSYESGNGIKTSGQGFLKKIFVPVLGADGKETGQEEEKEIVVQSGSYSYPSPDGELITITYIADENGFQPTGDHIPQPPAIPDEILSSLHQQASSGL